MEKGTRDIYSEQELSSKSIVELLEDVRLTSLNLAISSAKFKAYNLRQNQIKKDLSEMVALALEAVQVLSSFLVMVGIKDDTPGSTRAEVDHEKLERSLEQISEFIGNITDGFMKDRGLQ